MKTEMKFTINVTKIPKQTNCDYIYMMPFAKVHANHKKPDSYALIEITNMQIFRVKHQTTSQDSRFHIEHGFLSSAIA
jgi:hypothetical protein